MRPRPRTNRWTGETAELCSPSGEVRQRSEWTGLAVAPLLVASVALTMAGCAGKQSPPKVAAGSVSHYAEPPAPLSEPVRTTADTETSVCYDCFWEYQPAGFREELARWYEAHPQPDPLAVADRRH